MHCVQGFVVGETTVCPIEQPFLRQLMHGGAEIRVSVNSGTPSIIAVDHAGGGTATAFDTVHESYAGNLWSSSCWFSEPTSEAVALSCVC